MEVEIPIDKQAINDVTAVLGTHFKLSNQEQGSGNAMIYSLNVLRAVILDMFLLHNILAKGIESEEMQAGLKQLAEDYVDDLRLDLAAIFKKKIEE